MQFAAGPRMSATMKFRAHTLRIILALVAVYVIWGSTVSGDSLCDRLLPPFTMAGLRFVAAGLFMFTVGKLSSAPMPTQSEWQEPRSSVC